MLFIYFLLLLLAAHRVLLDHLGAAEVLHDAPALAVQIVEILHHQVHVPAGLPPPPSSSPPTRRSPPRSKKDCGCDGARMSSSSALVVVVVSE